MMLAMLAVQLGMSTATILRARDDATADLQESARFASRAVNDVQLSLDVAWDTLVCLSAALMCFATLRRGTIAAIWSILGLIIAIGGWIMQITTFPTPPGEAGLFALWMFGSWILIALSWRRRGRVSA